MSSQQLHEIENVADSVIFLKAGKLIYSGEVSRIGEERTENEFELQGDFDEAFLNSVFADIQIKTMAKTFHVKVPLETGADKFLQKLLEQKKAISYFRDISSSTRKLFNQ